MKNIVETFICQDDFTLNHLDQNIKYNIDPKKTSYTFFEENIIQCFADYDKNMHIIEFYLSVEKDNIFEYNKKTKQTPIFSAIFFLSDITIPNSCDIPIILFTDIEFESYKYKDIPDDNTYVLYSPKNKHLIRFNPKYYYKFIHSKIEGAYLKINLWESSSYKIEKIYDIKCENKKIHMVKDIANPLRESIQHKNLFNSLLYDNDTENTKIFQKIQKTLIKCNNPVICIIDTNNSKCINYDDLYEKYDNVAKDLIPFYDENQMFVEENRFFKKKVIEKALPIDVCYWIINECEKINDWKDSPYPNYYNYLNVEKLPHILNFLLFISNFWIIHIQRAYDFDGRFNIKDMFITKYKAENIDNIQYTCDDSFLIVNITLNSDIDYKLGNISFQSFLHSESYSNPDTILVKQGDMIIYSGKHPRSRSHVSDGEKYVLVLFLELKI
jgi:hypothetical protein